MGMTWGRMERSAWPDGQKAERAVQPLQRPVHHLEQPQNSAWQTTEWHAAQSNVKRQTAGRRRIRIPDQPGGRLECGIRCGKTQKMHMVVSGTR